MIGLSPFPKEQRKRCESYKAYDSVPKGESKPELTYSIDKDPRRVKAAEEMVQRVFYRKTATGYEILGKTDKANEQTIINILKKLYE